MMEKTLDEKKLKAFEVFLIADEMSDATVEKYMRDVKHFFDFAGTSCICKELIIEYKNKLGKSYAVSSANSMLAALNSFLRFCGWYELCVKRFHVQRQAFCTEEKELTKAEYARLLKTANQRKNQRLELMLQTICGTGIRVSELQYITVKSLPSADDGVLYVGSVGAAEGQVISAGSLSALSFAAADDTKPCTATLSLSVNGNGYEVACRFCLLPALNYTPTVSLAPEVSLSLETFADLTAVGTLSSYDPDGDQLTYEIVRYASHGRVSLTDKHTGAYTYVPDKGYTGSDAFSYVVRDEYGNYSTSTVVSITVSPRPTQPAFADIENRPAAASILKVSMNGLMNGTTVGGVQYFKPDASVSRVEFLVTAMHAAGITSDDVQDLGAPSFADAAEIPEGMAKFVSLAVRRGYVTGKEVDGELCFKPHESISKAETAVILSNIIGYAKQTTVTAFADADALPA